MKRGFLAVGQGVVLFLGLGLGVRANAKLGPAPPWYRPQRLALSETPVIKLTKEPAYQHRALYGELVLGNAPNNHYAVAVDLASDWSAFSKTFAPGNQPDLAQVPLRVYVDGNHDADLSNDGDGKVRDCRLEGQTTDRFIVSTDAELTVAYADGETVRWPVSFYLFPQRPPRKQNDGTELRFDRALFFYRSASFEATLRIGEKELLARFYDENSNAVIAAEEGDQVALDLNGDGQIEPGMKSPELLPLIAPFYFEGRSYKLAKVGVRGEGARIEASDTPAKPPVYVSRGHPAPDFETTTLDGKRLKLSNLRGNPVLLDFWATWCGPCRAELPNLVRLWKENRDRGLNVIGISLDSDMAGKSAADTVRTFARANGIEWTQVVEGKGWESKIGDLYQVSGIPQTVLVDKQGQIVAVGLRGEALQREASKLLQGDVGVRTAAGASPAPGQEALPANLTGDRRRVLQHGLRLLAQGDAEFARGHFEGALPPKPCRVLLVTEALPRPVRDNYLKAAHTAMRLWSQALPEWIDFVDGRGPEESPVQVFFVPTVEPWDAEAKRQKHVAGLTTTDAPHVGKTVPHRHTILVSIYQHGSQTLSSPETITHVVAHELGHVIGIGESSNAADIMGPDSKTPAVSLSEADIASARAVLECLTRLVKRAKQGMRPAQ